MKIDFDRRTSWLMQLPLKENLFLSHERKPVSIANLKVGLKCGGSDGFSGITANPLIGQFSDFLIAAGRSHAFG
jgi:altronate hydrolase